MYYLQTCKKKRISFQCVQTYDLVLIKVDEGDGAYLTFKSFSHKALNLLLFDCKITPETDPRTSHYTMKIECIAQGNNRSF